MNIDRSGKRSALVTLASFAAAVAVGIAVLAVLNVQVLQPWTAGEAPAATAAEVLQASFTAPTLADQSPAADEGQVIEVLNDWIFTRTRTRTRPSKWCCL